MMRYADTDLDEPGFSERFGRELLATAKRLGCVCTFDILFLSFLRLVSRFGYFTLGPITIDVRMIEDLVERTLVPAYSEATPDDFVRFSDLLMHEVRRSGRKRIDELHYLLAFMRCNEGLPARVFGELGVTPEGIGAYLKEMGSAEVMPMERLMTPEQVAEYLQMNVHTVRAWIRSGRLPARRVAGLRALRVNYSDVMNLLQPLDESRE